MFDIPGDAWQSSAMLDTIFGIGAEFPRTAMGWGQIIHPAERQQMLSYLRDITTTGGHFDREYRIVRVSDGAEAVAMARRTAYAAIFMDMQMPEVNGLEATQQIREMAGYRQTPIIAMTANVFGEDKERCLAAGMNDFLAKPYDAETLFAKLLRWLSRSPV